jgi:mRNA-degrading endonuclease RelE of RelBE toxin-antitoxin system
MQFRIADTFTDSLARLTGDEQKAVKTTAFDLQINPESPGMSFHKLDRARDKNFWSVRVNVDVRMIVHKADGSLMLCYVDHHDKAYDWAAKRKLETHPTTGAAQLVEIRETVQEILIPTYTHAPLGSSASAGMSESAAATSTTCARSTKRNGTCSTSHAHAPVITCSSQASRPHRNSWTTSWLEQSPFDVGKLVPFAAEERCTQTGKWPSH